MAHHCYYPELCNGVTQCYTCLSYERGLLKPEHPVPAIIYRVSYNTNIPGYDFSNSVILWQVEICSESAIIAAAWDFDPDRCKHFFLPYGKYVSIADITAGINARREIDGHGSSLQ